MFLTRREIFYAPVWMLKINFTICIDTGHGYAHNLVSFYGQPERNALLIRHPLDQTSDRNRYSLPWIPF